MPFTCIGDSWPNFDATKPGKDSHEHEGNPHWHNVYAGPFCHAHAIRFQHHAIAHHNELVGATIYECSRQCDICFQDSDD